MKVHAYELKVGDVVTSLVLDPAEPFVVDNVVGDEDAGIVKVDGYTEDTGESFSFIWGEDKALEVRR